MQEATDRVAEDGDPVAFDTDLVGPHGYLTDISRTYLCGEAPGSRELRDAYQAAYGFVHDAIPEFRAGRSFRELGELLGERLPPEYRRLRPFIAHGCGAADEYPVIVVEGNHEGELLPCMVLSVEGYLGRVGGKVGAKFEEQIIITDDALELISFAPLEPRPVVMDSPYLPLRPARRAPISPDRTHRARQPGRRHTRMPSLTAGPANSRPCTNRRARRRRGRPPGHTARSGADRGNRDRLWRTAHHGRRSPAADGPYTGP